MIVTILLLLLGFVLLVAGGELLVRGAVRLAERLGLSPMLIGLTVVGMGTSMPEMAASVQASLAGSPGIALGNIVGSNMANLLLILGVSALLSPAFVPRTVLWRDGMLGVVGALALIAAGYSFGLSRGVGGALLAVLVAYLVFAVAQERRGSRQAAGQRALAVEGADPALEPHETPGGSLWIAILLFLVGIGLIVAGGIVLVYAAIAIAAALGVSDTVIGLTVVAAGTSFPELATTVIAAVRKQGDIALGNVLGSNIFNIFFIGGVTGVIAPAEIPRGILEGDLWLLTGASLLAILFAYTGGRLGRREGGLLVGAYVAFVAFTVMSA